MPNHRVYLRLASFMLQFLSRSFTVDNLMALSLLGLGCVEIILAFDNKSDSKL